MMLWNVYRVIGQSSDTCLTEVLGSLDKFVAFKLSWLGHKWFLIALEFWPSELSLDQINLVWNLFKIKFLTFFHLLTGNPNHDKEGLFPADACSHPQRASGMPGASQTHDHGEQNCILSHCATRMGFQVSHLVVHFPFNPRNSAEFYWVPSAFFRTIMLSLLSELALRPCINIG